MESNTEAVEETTPTPPTITPPTPVEQAVEENSQTAAVVKEAPKRKGRKPKTAAEQPEVTTVAEQLPPVEPEVTLVEIQPAAEVKPKAKRAPRVTKKSITIASSDLSTVEQAPAEEPSFQSPIQLTVEQQRELIRNWMQVQSSSKRAMKQEKYKTLMSKAF